MFGNVTGLVLLIVSERLEGSCYLSMLQPERLPVVNLMRNTLNIGHVLILLKKNQDHVSSSYQAVGFTPSERCAFSQSQALHLDGTRSKI